MHPPKVESPLMLEAYEYFYALGKERRLALVAKKFGKSETAVGVWAKTFNWWDKVEARDKRASDRRLETIDQKIKRVKQENLDIIEGLRVGFATQIAEMKGRMKLTPTEFERLAKLELLLMGEATERIDDMSVAGVMRRATELDRDSGVSKTSKK